MTFDVRENSNAANVASLAIELLRGGLENLPNDREAATLLIARACSVLESAGSSKSGDSAISSGLMPWQIRKVKAHIDANIDKSLTVSRLAALVGLGPSHFQRTFKRSFGVSPHAFLLERRVCRAQTLLLATDEPLSVIALAVGFADQAHFTSRFHRATGVTPGAWRRERQERSKAGRRLPIDCLPGANRSRPRLTGYCLNSEGAVSLAANQ